MPSDKPIDCIKIDFDDLNSYRNNLPSNKSAESPTITNLLMLRSEYQTEGLKALFDSLNSHDKSTVDEIKKQHKAGLLKDLEALTKRTDFQEKKTRFQGKEGFENLEFKREFYEEIKKPVNERSAEFQSFLTSCSNFLSNDPTISNKFTVTEAISAKMLLEFDKPNITSESLADILKDRLNTYKKDSEQQTTSDIGGTKIDMNKQKVTVNPRAEILFKDKEGNTKIINVATLKNEKSFTGEQKEFITTTWHQGTFGAGWFTINSIIGDFQDRIQSVYPNGYAQADSDRDFLVIEVSSDDKVMIRSRLDVRIAPDIKKREQTVDYAQGVLEVDITDLKGKDFTPGCASAAPRMNAYISEFDAKLRYDLPSELKATREARNDQVRKTLIEDKKNAYINEIVNNGSKEKGALDSLSKLIGLDIATIENLKSKEILAGLTKVQIETIQNLPDEAKIETLAVKCYKKVEKDTLKRQKFASEQLGNYCDKQDVKVLDDKEIKRLKTGIISILEPIIEDENKTILETNVEAAIRACAKMENKEMSFGQKWRTIVIDPIKQFFGMSKEKKIVDQYPEIFKTFKNASNPGSISLFHQSSLKSNTKEVLKR